MNRPSLGNSDTPTLFLKPDTAILADDKRRFYIPDFSSNIHYETELVVKIDKMGKNIAEKFAARYYNEITLGFDFTARDIQSDLKKKGLPWEISKAFDNSAAIGSFVPKTKYTKHLNELNFHMMKNGYMAQQTNTSEMLYSVDKIISYASHFFTLKTGDLIFTGTPSGVGKVEIGDNLEAYLEDDLLLTAHIC